MPDAKRAPDLDRAPDPSSVSDLPPSPRTADLRAAASHGITYLEWVRRGRPLEKARAKPTKPSVRPWHPYRSKFEADYAKRLQLQLAIGMIRGFAYEADSLEIGLGARYTPDFRVRQLSGAVEYLEIKGYRREAAMVRLRVAAKLYPQFRFVLVTKVAGRWKHEVIGAKP